MARRFGIITNVAGLQCGITVNSVSRGDSVEVAEARDEKGRVTDLKAYSRGENVSIQGVVDDEKGEIVKSGSKLTLEGKDYLVESVDKPEQHTAFYEATISARTADDAVIHVYEEETTEPGA